MIVMSQVSCKWDCLNEIIRLNETKQKKFIKQNMDLFTQDVEEWHWFLTVKANMKHFGTASLYL